MEDDKNPKVVTPPSSDSSIPPVTTDDTSKESGLPGTPNKDSDTEAYRKEQSRADKATAEKDNLASRIDFLEGFVGESMKERMVTEFISENSTTYPNVSADDLKELVSSPDDFEKVAKLLQKKHEDITQSTLASVREVPDNSMTEDQIKAEKDKIQPNDPNRFSKWLHLQSVKRK